MRELMKRLKCILLATIIDDIKTHLKLYTMIITSGNNIELKLSTIEN